VHDLDVPRSDMRKSKSSLPSLQEDGNDDGTYGDDVDQYIRMYRTHALRCKILSNEIQDSHQEIVALQKKASTVALVREHLLKEEEKALETFRKAEAEYRFVRDQRLEQEKKHSEIGISVQQFAAKIDLLRATLQPIEGERDKAKVLINTLNPRHFQDLSDDEG